jgi:hypothetical protein
VTHWTPIRSPRLQKSPTDRVSRPWYR